MYQLNFNFRLLTIITTFDNIIQLIIPYLFFEVGEFIINATIRRHDNGSAIKNDLGLGAAYIRIEQWDLVSFHIGTQHIDALGRVIIIKWGS